MIIITDELLAKAFGELRVKCGREEYSWSVEELSKRGKYGDGIKYLIIYDGCSDPQKYVDNWMNSTIAKTEVAEYYKELSFKGEDNMNKYETLLKKYGKLCREFEVYKEVTEDIANKGTYITNEALEELKECKKKYDTLFKEHKAYCCASEDVAVKLIETEKKYDELKNERDALVQEVYHLHDVIRTRQEQVKEKTKQVSDLETIRLGLVKERDELKQRLDHINAMSNLEWKFEVVEETETSDTATIKTPYDELVEYCVDRRGYCYGCNTRGCDMFTSTPLKWTEEQIKEYNKANTETAVSSYDTLVDSCIGFTETPPATPYDELVAFCENRTVGCSGCPNVIACDSINTGFRPARWNEDEIAEYNELMAMKEDK